MNRQDYTNMIKRLGWIGLLFVVAILVISAIENKQASKIQTMIVKIEPLEDSTLLIQQGDVLLNLDRSFGFRFEGRPIKAVDVERIERVLEEDDFIQNADVYIDSRNVLWVKIKQREPMLRIIDKNGLNYYLDAEGYKMRLSPHFTTRVLVATGHIPPHVPDFRTRKTHVLKDLFELSQVVMEDDFLRAMVEQIYVSSQGDFVFIPLVGDQKIIFGKFDRVEKKIRNLKLFYKEAMPRAGWRKYKTINLKYKGQVVCK